MEEVRVRVGDAAPATTKSGLALALEIGSCGLPSFRSSCAGANGSRAVNKPPQHRMPRHTIKTPSTDAMSYPERCPYRVQGNAI